MTLVAKKSVKIVMIVLGSIVGLLFILGVIGVITGGSKVSQENKAKSEQRTSPNAENKKPSEAKPDTSDLNAEVKYNDMTVEVMNNEDKDWVNCRVTVNGSYDFRDVTFPKKEKISLLLSSFTKSDGTRFNYTTTAFKEMSITRCEGENSQRGGYFNATN